MQGSGGRTVRGHGCARHCASDGLAAGTASGTAWSSTRHCESLKSIAAAETDRHGAARHVTGEVGQVNAALATQAGCEHIWGRMQARGGRGVCTGHVDRAGGGSRSDEDLDGVITMHHHQHVSAAQMLDYCDDKIIDSNTRRCSTRDCRSSS